MPRKNMEARKEYQRKWVANKRAINHATRVETTTYVPAREPYVPLPSAVLSRRSSLVDAEGNVIQEWRIEKPEDKARWEALQEAIAGLEDTLPRAPLLPAPEVENDDYLVSYPIGDHHMGMLAWKYEVGASYDLDIGEHLLQSAANHLIGAMLPAKRALVVALGDFLHYDGMVPMTPGHGNPLDADGRAAKMVRAAVRTLRYVIEKAAEKHHFVHVVVEFGNHDPFATLWLQEALRIKYEDNFRITIDGSPAPFHYHRWEKNLFMTHHGDRVKMEDLPLIMATDRPQDWGVTTHRYIYTGHIHHRKALDVKGVEVESFRILAPNDAWAFGTGYRSTRDMKAIIYHKNLGECARYTFNPEMVADHA